eukprot:SAG31_NODE_25375_length_462_cov_1.137741_1_plen_35_part_01
MYGRTPRGRDPMHAAEIPQLGSRMIRRSGTKLVNL